VKRKTTLKPVILYRWSSPSGFIRLHQTLHLPPYEDQPSPTFYLKMKMRFGLTEVMVRLEGNQIEPDPRAQRPVENAGRRLHGKDCWR
jgi:hypothetical protein